MCAGGGGHLTGFQVFSARLFQMFWTQEQPNQSVRLIPVTQLIREVLKVPPYLGVETICLKTVGL